MNEHPSHSGINRRSSLRACALGGASLPVLSEAAGAGLARRNGKMTPGVASELAARPGEAFQEIDPRNTFASFMTSGANRFARAACFAVSEAPRMYNPLFIHGEAGSGKTHLLQAIGNRIRAGRPGEGVLYVTGRRPASEPGDTGRGDPQQPFGQRYLEADVLLFDDVQLLSGHERSQQDLLHIFDTLFDNHKQLVFSSDHPPDE